MKKLIIFLLIILVLAPSVSASREYDMDGNDVIDIFDVMLVWNHIDSGESLYDVDGDGDVDIFDARLVWNHIGDPIENNIFIEWIRSIIYG